MLDVLEINSDRPDVEHFYMYRAGIVNISVEGC